MRTVKDKLEQTELVAAGDGQDLVGDGVLLLHRLGPKQKDDVRV